ncbi:MAG: hypothetical protein Q9227_000662 [Pyrenula ochraceoflavens]
MSSLTSQLRTTHAFLDSFHYLDEAANLSLRTPNCRHIMAPTSLNIPEMNNERFVSHIQSIKPLFSTFPVKAKEIFANDAASRQVTVWATSEPTFLEDVKDSEEPITDWKYRGEYMFVLCFDESGEKIEQVVEFLDSATVEKVRALMQRAKKNLAEREKRET